MIENLVSDDSDQLERLFAFHAVHDHVPIGANEMFAVEDRVLVLLKN